MYIPASFRVEDREPIVSFVERFSFATLVCQRGGEPFASHLPLLLDRDRGEQGTLVGHLARANPHGQAFDGNQTALAIFHGPHAYISPRWYVNPLNVPTWNYATVHAYGRPRVIEDAAATSVLLERLVAFYEAGNSPPWSIDLPTEYRRQLEQAIVAFEMPIERWEAKFKLGQNRKPEDRHAMLEQLASSERPDDQSLSRFIASVERPTAGDNLRPGE